MRRVGLMVASIVALTSFDSVVVGGDIAVVNPGFEEPYSGGTARSWSPWHQELNANPKPAECADYYLVRPSWSPEFNGAIILDEARVVFC